jgi:DNA-binding winged helix-turn-helix (wHTH) protein/tetratricopeptide (TPR) repeat protein
MMKSLFGVKEVPIAVYAGLRKLKKIEESGRRGVKEFPPFRLDTANQCLWRRQEGGVDERILLTPKAFGVLRHLVEHAGRLVTHDELLDAVWPATHIQPQAVKKLVLDLRGALGDDAKKPVFIETVHRRGYRFIAAASERPAVGFAASVQPPVKKLVGRERSLGELRDCLGNALRDQRQIVFITGEPGIGKTALADEFQGEVVAEVAGIRIARGQCIEGYGGKEAYYPMLEALGQLHRGSGGEAVIQTLVAQAPTWLVQFPTLVKHEQRETLQREILVATRERMLREIGDALETLAAQNPLLLVFEDLQWVDYATVDLISALARRRAPAKLMLIATKRPLDVVNPEHPLKVLKDELLVHQLCREIVLQPLQEGEVAEYLAAESSQASLPEGLGKLLYSHTEGNPLFMVAALEHMIGRGLVSTDSGSWKLTVPLAKVVLEVPQKLRRMIDTQIDSLSKEEQRILEVASVSGVTFSAGVSAAAANLSAETVEEICERLSRRYRIVRPAGSEQFSEGGVASRYEFVHALYREVCYRRQAPGYRAKLHHDIGQRLEELFSDRLAAVAAELAHHFEQSSDWSRAVKYLQLAAETARRRYAHREAAANLQHALELSSKLAEAERATKEVELLELLGMIYAGDYDIRALESFEAMADRAKRFGLIDAQARALVGLAYPLSWISSERCIDALDRAILLSDRQTGQVLRATLRMNCSFYRIWAGGWNSRHAEEYRNALNDIREAGDPVTVSYHVAQYSMLQWVSSKYREADHDLTQAASYLLGIPPTSFLNLNLIYWVHQLFSSSSLLFLGEWGKAFSQFKAAIELLDENGDEYRAKTLRLYLALAHLEAMDFDGVLRICEASFHHPEDSLLGVEPASSSAFPEEARICLILKGSAQSALGNFDDALDQLLAVRDAMDQQMVIIDWYWRMPLELALAELWLGKGDLARAKSQAEKFLGVTLETAEHTWQARAWQINAQVAMAQDQLDRAGDCIDKALSTMDGFEVPLAAWRVHATATEYYERIGEREAGERQRELARITIRQLADSLQAEESLQKIFLSAPLICKVLDGTKVSSEPHRRRQSKGAIKPT